MAVLSGVGSRHGTRIWCEWDLLLFPVKVAFASDCLEPIRFGVSSEGWEPIRVGLVRIGQLALGGRGEKQFL